MRFPPLLASVAAACIASTIALGSAQAQQAEPQAAPASESAPPAVGAPSVAAAPTWKQTADKIAEARKHYELGLKLYDDNDFEGAHIEFERALALAPSYRILYNIGLAYARLNNYVEAVGAYERYLMEGGPEVPAERRMQIDKEIAELQARIATVQVTSSVVGAELSIDGVVHGKTPLALPLKLNPGVRKISATAPGYLPVAKSITVGAGANPDVRLELQELPKAVTLKETANPWTIPTVVGWSATAAATVSTVVVGVLALGAKSNQSGLLAKQGVSQADLLAARDKTQTLAAATDVLLVTTAVFAGISGYFTWKLITTKPTTERTTTRRMPLQLGVGLMSISAAGNF